MKKEIFDNIEGLTKEIIPLFDFSTVNFSNNECSCDIVINDKFTSKDKAIDDGVLLALIDTFSSYAVMFLSPEDDYKTYLSLSIKMTSFNSTNSKRLTIKVFLEKKFDRNILLNITVSDPKGNIIKRISHLKRRIASKL